MSAVANDLGAGIEILWYKIESVLGRGGFGITYLATDTNLGQLVAIKEYLPHEFATRGDDSTVQPVSKDQENTYNWGLERFMSEAQILAKFKHPNIVRVLSVFKHNNTGYMVMEYESGRPLNKIYAEKKHLSQPELEAIYYPIIEGLIEVHKQGFIHRDIKPANIFIRDDGSPVLIDFGAARHAVGSKTRTLTAMLTIGYAPFEQYNEGSEKQGPWTDIYALSACLHEGVTGSKPVDSMQRGMALLHNEADPYTPLSWHKREGFDPGFQRGVDQGLMIQVHDRPQTLQEFMGVLRGNIQLEDIPPQPRNEDTSLLVKTLVRPVQAQKDKHEVEHPVQGTEIEEQPETSDLGLKPRTEAAASQIDSTTVATTESPQGLWKKQGKLISTGLVAVVIVLLLVILWPENNDQAPDAITIQPPVVTPPPPAQPPIDTRQVRIDELLQQAEQYYIDRIYFNSGSNHALERYRQVLSLDKQHQLAIERIQEIGITLLVQADAAIGAGNLVDAGFLLDAVAGIDPDFTGLKGVLEKLTQAKQKDQDRNRLEKLLNLAGKAMNAGLVYSPENKNALTYYQQVLKIDPNNTQAHQGLKRITDILVTKTRKALNTGQLDLAGNLLVRLESTSPDHSALAALKRQLSVDKQIQRLIRKAQAAYKKQHYTVPESGSAVSLYREVLTLSPGHKLAMSRLDVIAKKYSTTTRNSIRSGKISKASYTLNILRKQFPKHTDIQALSADLKALQAEIEISRLLPVGIEQGMGDDAAVEAIVDRFVTNFKNRNIKQLKLVSQLNERQEGLFTSLFNQYLSLNLTLVSASYTINKKQGKASAKFKITDLIDKNGHSVMTSADWTRIGLTIRKKNDAWLKAEINNY